MFTNLSSEVLWQTITDEASTNATHEPEMASYFHASIISAPNMTEALAAQLAEKLSCKTISAISLNEVFLSVLQNYENIIEEASQDIQAYYHRDPACEQYLMPLLNFKGFQAIQAYRIAHALWKEGRKELALYLQSRISRTFAVDVHPAAVIGSGVMIDHATGLVIGETSVIGNNVSMLHSVTFGGSGLSHGDRHPKVSDGVLIGAGAKLLGNIKVGKGAKIAAGSVVLNDVEEHVTVAGVPAKVVGRPKHEQPSLDMQQGID